MKLKKLLLTVSASTAFLFGAQANATAPIAACVSTPLVQFDGTIVDAALETPELSTLVDLVVAADLVDALSETPNLTVYAPTNDAFAAVPEELVGVLLSNTEALTSVLTYHVSPGRFDPRQFIPPVKRPTLQGTPVVFHRQDGHPQVNQANVSCQGVQTSNGRVWIIDKVILPLF
jgi:uncharacterized surface protein with fasciclin (FAS1) repeats